MKNPFQNANIRTLYIPQHRTYYYHANDVCQYLLGGTYAAAKSYWKYLKRTHAQFSQSHGYVNTMLKFPCPNGRFHACDVLTPAQLLVLLRLLKHKNARIFQKWLCLLPKNTGRFSVDLFPFSKANAKNMADFFIAHQRKIVFIEVFISKRFNLTTSPSVTLGQVA